MKHNYYIIITLLLVCTIQSFAQAPKINSLVPSAGPVGTKVTVYGSGFSTVLDSNMVYFGATRAAVTASNPSQLSVTVPAGATYKPVTVINKLTRLSGRSALAFNVSFPLADVDAWPKVKLPGNIPAAGVHIADIDGDGKTDILATNPVSGTLMVYLNKSKPGQLDTGSFAAPVVYKTGSQSGFVAVEDLDGDGNRDILVMNTGYALKPDGNNSLMLFNNTSKPGHIKLMAVVVTDSTKNAPATYNFKLQPGDFVARVTDFDGDGKPDIAVLNSAGYVSVYRNKYAGGSQLVKMFSAPVTIPVTSKPVSFIIGDMDSDGKPDIITASSDSASLTVLRNISGTGALTASSFQRLDFPLGFHPVTASLADVDGDGKLDVAISRQDDKLTLLHNNSTAGRLSVISIVLPKLKVQSDFNNDMVMQDMDGDGKPDMVSLNTEVKAINLHTNKSTPGLTGTEYFNKEVSCPVVTLPDCVGDLDGDGRPDMVVGNYFGIEIYHNKPTLAQASFLPQPLMAATQEYLNIYPNPASTATNVNYYLPVRANALITVHDNFGKKIISFNTGEQDAGDHVHAIQTSNLRMGLYLVTVSAGTYTKTGKLLIQ